MSSDFTADGAGSTPPFQLNDGEGYVALTTLFDLLSDETRLRIVSALAAHEHAHPDKPAIGFTALRERVDARDSGRFNYHLRKLDNILIEKTEEGYLLTPVGRKIITFVSDVQLEPIPA